MLRKDEMEETALKLAGLTHFLGGSWIMESGVSGTEVVEKFLLLSLGLLA